MCLHGFGWMAYVFHLCVDMQLIVVNPDAYHIEVNEYGEKGEKNIFPQLYAFSLRIDMSHMKITFQLLNNDI